MFLGIDWASGIRRLLSYYPRLNLGIMKRLLLIGALPPPIGGTTVSFEILCNHFQDDDNVRVADVNQLRSTQWKKIKFLIKLFADFSWSTHVSFHFSDRASIWFGVPIVILAKATFKHVSFRQFGGEFDDTYRRLSPFGRFFVRNVLLKASVVYFQTKSLIVFFQTVQPHANIIWLPTSRLGAQQSPAYDKRRDTSVLRLVYVGQIHKAKGIREAAEAVAHFDDVSLDIYGPIHDDYLVHSLRQFQGVSYGGVLDRDRVFTILESYDVFVMPSYHPGEGYSGSVIEALMCGLPVITTEWKSLPELVDETCGVLIPIKDVNAICSAIDVLKHDQRRLTSLSAGARQRGRKFEFQHVVKIFERSF